MINKEGLRQKPSYNQLIDEIATDKKITLPDRRAKFMRDSPYLSFLDNETYLEMEDQQNKLNAQQQAQQTIQQLASSSAQTASVLRSQVTNPFGGGGIPPAPPPTPPMGPAPNPFGPGATPPPLPRNQFGGGRSPDVITISTPNITPPIGPENDASIMDLESIFFGMGADQVPQMNVPQAIRPSVDVARLEGEGLYPNIEGSGSALSSATASELAMRNVMQLMGEVMDTDSRAKREPEADADDTPPASKAKSAPKPKARPSAKAKAKAQAIDNPSNPEETAPPIFVTSPEDTGGASSSSGPANPKAKAKAPSGIKKTIEKDSTPKAKPEHGTKIERLSKRMLRGKNLGYMVDQMQLRGKKFLPTELKGKNKLTKNQLAEMILEWDSKNPPA